MASHRVCSEVRAVSLVLLASVGLGCATTSTSPEQEDEMRLRKARSHFNLGVDYLRTDQVALGLRELIAAEELDPDNARVHFAIGEAYLRRGKWDEAEHHYRRVLQLAPDFHDARLTLSALYLRTERYEECIGESALLADDATFPGPWRALANRGWAEFKLGRVREARASLEQARDYRPSYWPALLSLGILESEQGRKREAVELFTRVLDQRPNAGARAEANYRLGEIFVSLGKRERALDYLYEAVADAPEGPWGEKSEEYLKLLR